MRRCERRADGTDVVIPDAPSRILGLSIELKRGIAVTLAEHGLFRDLFDLLWNARALNPAARRELVNFLGTGDAMGACAVLLRRSAFRRKAAWAVFWGLTDAALGVTAPGFAATHEPELNGAFMGMIAASLASFPATAGSNAAVVIGDHATLGNEARTGCDFGLVLEVEHRGVVRHLVTLLQAKRATSSRSSVDRAAGEATQLELLVDSGIGSFLFYHAHGNPAGLGPTVRDATTISALNRLSVDVVSLATDLAARLAVGVDNMFAEAVPYALPGMGVAEGRKDALGMLFNPNVPGLRVNGVVVARVGAQGLSPRAVADFESDWRGLVDAHRETVERSQGLTYDRGEEREPPLAQT